MASGSKKFFTVAVFSIFFSLFSLTTSAQNEGGSDFDANKVIFGHVMDGHEFHFATFTGKDGKEQHVTIPLPIILYSPERGLDVFMSSKFHHGEDIYRGYQIVTEDYRSRIRAAGVPEADIRLYKDDTIIAVDEAGNHLRDVRVYDFSMTRNVVQMILALTVLVLILTSMAKKYKKGIGVTSAPTGLQNAIEPVIAFVRDDVAKPNLGHKYHKYMPYLLTVFFFILINNIFGLIPGAANVTGNIAFTAVLGVISFLVINISGNKHYWGHIFNPPVPFGIKFIMVPVEILSIFTKPFALIIRLFANMLAGHIIIICLISLIFIFGSMSAAIGWGFSPISIAFTVFIFLIEILVAFIQAFIFTNLTAVFIGQSIEEGHSAHDEDNLAPARPVIIG